MSNWQEWVIALLLLLCVIRIGMSVYAFFRRAKEGGNPCDTCATGCDLKQLLDEKRAECGKGRKKRRKVAAGSWKFQKKYYLCIRNQEIKHS